MNKHLIASLCTLLSFSALQAQDNVTLVTLRHPQSGLTLSATNYGARVVSLCPFGTDVALGFDRLSSYYENKQNLGAVVGRFIGRILYGHLEIDGTTYPLQLQKSGDCGHGGDPNFGRHVWQIVPQSVSDTTLTLRYVSPDGENGFPGTLTAEVTYTVLADALRIDYTATTDRPTVYNPTNHTFFNLTGDLGRDILAEEVWIDSDSLALYDKNKRVTGKMGAVADTPFDFRTPRAIGAHIDDNDNQLQVTKGYDHCFQLKRYLTAATPEERLAQPVARLTDRQSGLFMEVYTTEPALQLYSANGLKGNLIGKDGKRMIRRGAVCFETMHFPDSPNQPQWPSTLLRPNETFRSTTIYRFGQL